MGHLVPHGSPDRQDSFLTFACLRHTGNPTYNTPNMVAKDNQYVCVHGDCSSPCHPPVTTTAKLLLDYQNRPGPAGG